MDASDFKRTLSGGPFVFDGGMGTQLYERGVYVNRSFDEANLRQPDLVREIHSDYIAHGAQAISTNTFSSNPFKLARHGLEDQAEAILRAGCRIARQAAGDQVFVAGSIGPTGLTPSMLTDAERDRMAQVFRRQVELMLEEGVDILCLETFRLLAEARVAIEAAQAVAAERGQEVAIVAQMAFDAEHRTGDGAQPERVAMLLADWGAHVIGANCLEGPHNLFEVLGRMGAAGLPRIAQPNAGYPRRVADRLVYMATPEYFGVWAKRFFKAGVALVGGCCGTSPAHTQRIASAARMLQGARAPAVGTPISQAPARRELVPQALDQVAAYSGLARKVDRIWRTRLSKSSSELPSRQDFAVSVEVNPPRGLDPAKALRAASCLVAGGVDVINIADGPRASVRMSNWALAQLLAQQGIETILHVCARDRNLLGLQADLLAYNALGLHNMVMITGDPPKTGDYPHATAVFDLDSVGLLHMAQGFNQGIDPSGKPVHGVTSMFCACGAEPAAHDYDGELRRLEKKRDAGAQLIMTQPVYDPEVLERFLRDTQDFGLPVMVGLLPLASWRNAEFLHHEVPGMSVPQSVRDQMKRACEQGAEQGRAMGVAIAQQALLQVAPRVVGAYIMPPFGRYSAALEILSALPGYELPHPPQEE